jgi:hypothetical protein
MIKKVVISSIILILVVFIVGCLDYKAYEVPEENVEESNLVDDSNLIDEIAAIEEELNFENEEVVNTMVDELMEETNNEPMEEKKEVVIPELEQIPPSSKDVLVVEVNENELVNLDVKVTDPDEDDVTYTFSAPLDNLGKWQTNYGDAGEYLVTLKATDGQLTTEQQLKVIVNRVNVPPVIDAVTDIKVKEGEVINFEPVVSDPNNDPVSVTVTEPLRSGSFTTDHTSSGDYQITITASDGELTSEKKFLLSIEDVNELPVIQGLTDLTVREGDTVNIFPIITDLDEDEVELTISEPVGNDGVWETSFTDHGTYVITVSANDGKDTVTKKVNLAVSDVNMPPEIVDVSLNIK